MHIGNRVESMKLFMSLLLLLSISFFVSSCASGDTRRAGGGAYDDSAFARGLDANNPAALEGHTRSYDGWRNVED